MELGRQILFFVSALGVFNGFILSQYLLLFKKDKNISNRWLGLLLLALSLRIGKSVLRYFYSSTSEWILQLGLTACLFIGPFLYFYVCSAYRPERPLSQSTKLQLSLLLACAGVGLIYPYKYNPQFWNPDFVIFIYTVWIVYVISTIWVTRDLWPRLLYKNASTGHKELWLLSLIIANLTICAVFNSILYFGVPSYVFGPISFSFLFYVLGGFILFSPLKDLILHNINSTHKKPRKTLDKDLIQQIKSELSKAMTTDKSFLDHNLKLESLAHKIGTTPHHLSQYINDQIGKNFNSYINELRVEEAATLLLCNDHYSFEGIANEVGFRSKSTFYAAFKARFNMTPKSYILSQRQSL